MLNRLCFLTSPRLVSFRHPFHRLSLSSPSRRSLRRQHTTAVLRPNIAVIGGGHAGISAALRLVSLPWTRLTRPSVTLIDKSEHFTFLPMLYELALSQVEEWEIAPKFEDLLADSGVSFLQGQVENLDLSSGAAEGSRTGGKTRGEFRVPFDRLVLALGAQAAGLQVVPGAREFAMPFWNLKDALALKERVAMLRKTKSSGQVINIVVVGGGYSGVEIASCLADELSTAASILVVDSSDRLLQNGTNFNRQTSEEALKLGGVVCEYRSRVIEITKDEVAVRRKGDEEKVTRYPADLVIWTAGSSANANLPNFDIPLDERGRIIVDSFMQVKDFEGRLFALGDAASTSPSSRYAGTAQVATQQAEYAAWNTWASLTGKPKLEYRYAHLGEMMVLGSKNATVTTSVGLELDGAPAWAARRIAYLARMPTDRHRVRVAASWAANPLLSGMGNLVKESRKYRTGNFE